MVESDTDLITKIFKTLGTPTEDTWIGISNMISILMPKYPQKKIMIEGMEEEATQLLNQMLVLNPRERISAKEALQHAFFTAEYE
jgi:serine/threonine protein kinase